MKTTITYSLNLLFLMLGLALSPAWSASKSAEDYLYGGGAKYIQSRLQEASVEVEEGLSKYPNDAKLKTLSEQLKKMKDQNKKDQGGQGSSNNDDKNKDQDKDKKDQDKKDGSGKDKESQDKKDQDKDKDKDEKKDQKPENQPKPGEEKKEHGDSTGQGSAPKPTKPGELSKEEAERLLNSYQDDEKKEHQQMKQHQGPAVDVEKDW